MIQARCLLHAILAYSLLRSIACAVTIDPVVQTEAEAKEADDEGDPEDDHEEQVRVRGLGEVEFAHKSNRPAQSTSSDGHHEHRKGALRE